MLSRLYFLTSVHFVHTITVLEENWFKWLTWNWRGNPSLYKGILILRYKLWFPDPSNGWRLTISISEIWTKLYLSGIKGMAESHPFCGCVLAMCLITAYRKLLLQGLLIKSDLADPRLNGWASPCRQPGVQKVSPGVLTKEQPPLESRFTEHLWAVRHHTDC